MKRDSEAAVMPFLGSLRAVMKAMGALPGPKHAVLLSSGWLMTERDAAIEIATVAADAAASNVTIHTFTSEDLVPTASQRRPSPTPGQDRNMLVSTVEMVSGMTGGRAVRMAAKGDLAFASLTAGLGGYYRLGVRARPEDLDGKPHQISLKVTKSGARLAGHRRVLAATAKAPSAPVDATKALRAAIESPTPATGLELSATSYVLHGTEAASRHVARRGRRRRGARVGGPGDGGGGALHPRRSAGDRDRSPARARRCRHDAGHGIAHRAARAPTRCASRCATSTGTSAASSASSMPPGSRPGRSKPPGWC